MTGKRFLVFGGRDFTDRAALYSALDRLHAKAVIACIIEGEARGADALAREWAEIRGIEVERYPADWATLGNAAGPIRNATMIKAGKPDGAVGWPGGAGTRNMAEQLDKAGITIWWPIGRV